MSFIKSELIEVVEWLDDTNYTLVWRFPDEDHELKMGANLICRPGQAAIFVNEGKVADVFGPGTYKLTTQNMPILTTLKSWPSGFESPFKAEVYFINLRQYLDQKWGTASPVIIRDAEFAVGNRAGKIPIRAYGNYNFRISDPKVFFEQIVGTNGLMTTDDIERYVKSRIVMAFSKAASQSNVSVIDMAGHVDVLSQAVVKDISEELGTIGLTLTSFIIENISLPPAIQKAIEEAAAQAARGVDNTMAWEGMQAMRDVAKNAHKGSGGGAAMNAGMGMGMGMGMGNMMGNMMGMGMPGYPPQGYPPQGYPPQGHPPQGYPPQGAPPPQQAAAGAAPGSLEDKLTKLKAAFEAGLLTEEEYKAKRAKVLEDF